jgi:predicted  nucleic acid-binding Zn-ribbon protein
MAIKTKKITELGQIEVENIDILKKSDFYFLGCMGGVTGKVSTSDVVNAIRANVEDFVYPHQNTEIGKISDRTTTLETNTENMRAEIDRVVATLNNTSLSNERIVVLEEKVQSLETKNAELEAKAEGYENRIAALESFVQALQADGYLTLANIKKAAADACPIETPAE